MPNPMRNGQNTHSGFPLDCFGLGLLFSRAMGLQGGRPSPSMCNGQRSEEEKKASAKASFCRGCHLGDCPAQLASSVIHSNGKAHNVMFSSTFTSGQAI